MKPLLFLITLLATSQLAAEPYDTQVNHQPETEVQIKLDTENYPNYKKLGRSVGLEFGVVYGYDDFASTAYANRYNSEPVHERLLLSTGRIDTPEAEKRAKDAYLHWEMAYFRYDDMTIIHAVKRENGRRYVQLMKLAKGRITDLHLR